MAKGFLYDKYFNAENKEATLKKLKAMGEYAKELGVSQACLALA